VFNCPPTFIPPVFNFECWLEDGSIRDVLSDLSSDPIILFNDPICGDCDSISPEEVLEI
jgi:hypothetical protein